MEERVDLAVQDFYEDDGSWCYGCGRLNKKGHQFRTGWNGDQTLTIYKPLEEHTAAPGFVYGGLIASLIDCHGTGSASLALHRRNGHELGDGAELPRFVTASIKVDFKKPTPHGATLKAIGTIEEIHPKKWKISVDVFANEEICVQGEVIAVVMPSSFRNGK